MAKFKTRVDGTTLAITDVSKVESLIPYAPVVFYDDYLGSGIDARWTAIDTSTSGDTTPLLAADVANGVARFPLDSTSEAQQSGHSWGNQRSLALDHQIIIEYRAALSVLPTLLSEAVWGLAGDTNAVFDTIAQGIWFKADGGGAIVVETDDGTTDNNDVATGVTLTAGEYAVFRIDCTDATDIKFYIDGNRVASGTTFSANATPTLALQPYAAIGKASGAGLGVLDVDYVRVWSQRA